MHNKRKSRCRKCGGSALCKHNKEKRRCLECAKENFIPNQVIQQMTQRDLIHELTLNGMKGISRLKKEILRNQLKLIRLNTGTSGQVATSDASDNNGSKGSDPVAYDSDRTDATADEYDSDATDCSEMEIDGFIVYSKRCAWV